MFKINLQPYFLLCSKAGRQSGKRWSIIREGVQGLWKEGAIDTESEDKEKDRWQLSGKASDDLATGDRFPWKGDMVYLRRVTCLRFGMVTRRADHDLVTSNTGVKDRNP